MRIYAPRPATCIVCERKVAWINKLSRCIECQQAISDATEDVAIHAYLVGR